MKQKIKTLMYKDQRFADIKHHNIQVLQINSVPSEYTVMMFITLPVYFSYQFWSL
jgi:hypothetical protein